MSPALDGDVCYRAIQTRDRRFDGLFFTGVRSTGIFCRPVCPAKVPKRENCTFYRSAAAAQRAGYRPCLRCRPEIAPQLWPASHGVNSHGADIVTRALRRIGAGVLDEISVGELAAQLGVSDRYLRRRFMEDLGTAPSQVAKTGRLLFAKQLITDTSLTMTEIAIAAGFKSIRSFNRTLQGTYGCTPTQLRRHQKTAAPTDPIALKLSFSPPYNWEAIAAFRQGRATPGLTVATAERYCRTIELEGHQGWISVEPITGQNYLLARIAFPKVSLLAQIVARLQQMFDLNANGAAIEEQLRQDPLFEHRFQSGLRIPGAWDGFELAVRAIVGQQVSVAAANRLFERIVTRYGKPFAVPQAPAELRYVFPQASVLAGADLTEVGVIRARAAAISRLAQAVVENPRFFDQLTTLDQAIEVLCQLKGIGPWTAHYIAMRALQATDAFPPGDVGLLRGMAALGESLTKGKLQEYSSRWQPWRGYAAMQLWAVDSQSEPAVE